MSTEVERALRDYERARKRTSDACYALDAARIAVDEAQREEAEAEKRLMNAKITRDAAMPNQCFVCRDAWSQKIRRPAHIIEKTNAGNLRVSKNGTNTVSAFALSNGTWKCGEEYLENVPAGFQ